MKNGIGKLIFFYLKNKGTENYPDGAYFEGNFVKSKKNGYGKMFLANGNIYEGEFNNDKISGYVF